MVEHFKLSLFLSIYHLLQGHDFIDQQAVGLRHLGKQFLELLDLLLGGRQLLRNDTDVLAGGKIFGDLWFPRSRSLPSDIIQLILTIGAEVRMFELEYLDSVYRLAL